MKKQIFIVALVFITGLSTNLFSQDEPFRGGLFKNYGVAVKAGLYGYGFDLSTSLHPNIKARLGYNYYTYDYNSGINFDGTGLVSGNDITITLDKANFSLSHVNLLFDFFPMQSGIFHFTAGAYFGQNQVKVMGSAPEKFAAGDYEITPINNKFDATVKLGSSVKPYFGIGLGRTITNSRVGFKFELGVVYQGNLSIESANADTSGMNSEISKLDIPTWLVKLWPMMTFSLSYRIN